MPAYSSNDCTHNLYQCLPLLLVGEGYYTPTLGLPVLVVLVCLISSIELYRASIFWRGGGTPVYGTTLYVQFVNKCNPYSGAA